MYYNETADVTLVNVDEVGVEYAKEEAFYIGRAVPNKGLSESVLKNPHKVEDQSGDTEAERRMEAVLKYVEYLYDRMREQSAMQSAVNVARGKVLVCWCEPALCHGHVLAAHHAITERMGAIDMASPEVEERVAETIKQQRRRAEAG